MIRFENASFHYGGEHGTGEGVDELNISIADGECVVLCGASGCGKTTVTRLINGLCPHFYEGKTDGAVYIEKEEQSLCVTTAPLYRTAALVGSVFQNPKSQFFNADTTGELAFGCENMGLSREEITERIACARDDLQLDALMDRNIFELSGGEKQQIACGCVYAQRPLVYVLDEPSSNLDKKAINRLRDNLMRIKESGATLVISEHRLYYLMDLADRFLYMDDGRIAREYTNAQMRALRDEELQALGLRCTDLANIRVGDSAQEEHTGRDTKEEQNRPAIEALDLSCNRGATRILDIDRMSLPINSIVALIGDNGCGKSTLAETLCGVIPSDGSVAFRTGDKDKSDLRYLSPKQRTKKSFLVMQDVNRQLFSDSVLEETMLGAEQDRENEARIRTEEEARRILSRLGLEDVADRHPASLSGGQKQRTAIASALAAGKETLFYDEPTSGLDRRGMERFAALLRETRNNVNCSVIITHDPELILSCCTHVCHVENGRILSLYPLNEEGVRRMRAYFLSPDDESTSQKRERITPVGKILQYAGKWKRYVFLAAALMICGSACSMAKYVLVYQILRDVLEGAFALRDQTLRILGVFLSETCYAILYVRGLHYSHHAAYRTLQNIRCFLQEKTERQPLGNILETGSGAMKKLFVDDVESIELLLAHMIPEGIGNTCVAAAVLLLMIRVDWQMALLCIVVIAFGVSASGRMYTVGMDKMGSYFAAAKRLNNTIIEYVNGMEAVRVYNRTKDAGEKYERHVYGYRDFALFWYKVCWPWMALYGSLFATTTLYALPFGALMIALGRLTLTRYLLVLCLSFGLGTVLLHLIGFMGAIPQVSYKIQALEKSMDRAPLITGAEPFSGRSYDVTFDRVRFAYRSEEVLKEISFTAKEGCMTALVGPSGSGKTTIARLLAHYYDASEGRIAIGGQDIRKMSPEAFTSLISLVSQELFLFNDTILENIRIGDPKADDAQVMAAAAKAQCDEFIRTLPDGYETKCGEGGAKLSGGQRQRIAFARAILKDAPVLILDEATAFIDPENEQKMRGAIHEMTKNKTVVVIAHRLHTIQDADQIIALSEGEIEATGTHAELMETCPLYRTLTRQSEDVANWGLKGGAQSAAMQSGKAAGA